MKSKLIPLIGSIIGIVFTALLLSRLDFPRIKDAFLKVNLLYLPIIIAFTLLAYAFRALRLKVLLKSAKPSSFFLSYVNIHTGNFYNHILPGKAGELFRIYHLNKSGLTKSASIAILLAERSFDVISMIVLFAINFFVFKTGFKLDVFKSMLFVSFFVFIILILILSYFKKAFLIKALRGIFFFLSEKIKAKIDNTIDKFSKGLHILKSPVDMLICLMLSFVIIAIFSFPVYLSGASLGIGYGYEQSYFILAYILLSFLLPSPPGNIGAFEYFFVLALVHLGYNKPESLFTAALFFHISQFIAAIGVGIFFVPKGLFKNRKALNTLKN